VSLDPSIQGLDPAVELAGVVPGVKRFRHGEADQLFRVGSGKEVNQLRLRLGGPVHCLNQLLPLHRIEWEVDPIREGPFSPFPAAFDQELGQRFSAVSGRALKKRPVIFFDA
jgi:hypothetical protein